MRLFSIKTIELSLENDRFHIGLSMVASSGSEGRQGIWWYGLLWYETMKKPPETGDNG
jgi:hypothetical protein